MVTNPGLAKNGSARFSDGSAFENCGRHWGWRKQNSQDHPCRAQINRKQHRMARNWLGQQD